MWLNVWGLDSVLDGQPLPAGTVITAYDPQGVVCGGFVVVQPGEYGLMAVYRDDPLTSEDEGLTPGETMEFRINGLKAQVIGPDEPIWTAMGDLKQLELAAQTPP